ncbi:MAG TPA: hypothetical protein VNM40_00010 [Candidatus Paceibacterota bacterium]|nr:hypothetical protein [Candidatus Paceibacterota bacterium]
MAPELTQEIDLGGTIYISSKRASEISGYAQDYIGQLARSGQIDAKRISGLWYVLEDSLRAHKEKADLYVPKPPTRDTSSVALEALITVDGREYVSAQRASKITGYSGDYVGQLARSSKIPSRRIGNRWYVDRLALIEHKKHNDQLLAAVQSESVGISREISAEISSEISSDSVEPHFKYVQEAGVQELIPEPTKPDQYATDDGATHDNERASELTKSEPIEPERNQIPIRVSRPVNERTSHRFIERVATEPTRTPSEEMRPAPSLKRFGPQVVMLSIVTLGVAASAGAAFWYSDRLNSSIESVNSAVSSNVPALDRGFVDGLVALVAKELYFKR